jgi:hypothetical protein
MYQDGTIGGHISLIPKKFANGILRAIVEIDENGMLVGNLRLVPGGPLRVKLNFATAGSRVDLRDALISPLGAIGNVAERFRQFKFTGMTFELRLFNRSIFDISANLRIPFESIKKRVDELVASGVLRRGPDGKLTGLFSILREDPQILRFMFRDVKSTVFGNIRFSSLSQEAVDSSAFLRGLQGLNVRLLNRAHLTTEGLQNIATNMRIHGWNIYDIANVLRVRWDQARDLVTSGMYRIKGFAEDLGVVATEDLLPVWEARLKKVTQSYRRSPQTRSFNEVDALNASLKAIEVGMDNVNPIVRRNILELIGAKPGDNAQAVYLKARNMINFVRMNEGIDSNVLRRTLDNITEGKLRTFGREVQRMPQTKLRALHVAGDEIIGEAKRAGAEELSLLRRIADERPNSAVARYFAENEPIAFRHPGLLARQGLDELDDGEFFITMPDGSTRRLLAPYVRMDFAEWERYLDDLADIHPTFWDDVYAEMDFMATRYTKFRAPDIVIDDFPGRAHSPFYNMDGTIAIPFLDEGKPSKWIMDWGPSWRQDSALREAAGEVTGRQNPIFVHEYTHYLHDKMINDPDGQEAILNGITGVERYLRVPEGDNSFGKEISYAIDQEGMEPDEAYFFISQRGLNTFYDEPFTGKIEDELGEYATTNWYEFIAEANRHYLTDDDPGPIATIIGEAMDEYFGIEARRR